MSEDVLKRYIRIGKKPVGCVVAVKGSDGRVTFGYSLCHRTDQFSKKQGTKIAVGRSQSGFYTSAIAEDTRYDEVIGELFQMAIRASLYFKQDINFVESVDIDMYEDYDEVDLFEEARL